MADQHANTPCADTVAAREPGSSLVATTKTDTTWETVPHPGPYPVLVAVLGGSPAVITETLWSLYRRTPPFVPDRIVVFTTTHGAARLDDRFFAALQALCKDHRQPAPTVLVHVPVNDAGERIHDTADREQEAIMANLIYNEVRNLTLDGEPPVHASIAGGRKTMSTRLGGAMSLFGRGGDEVSHVLVHPEFFEKHPDFFFIPKNPVILTNRDGETLSTSGAQIDLVEHCFWPLRGLVDEGVLKNSKQPLDFEDLESAVQATLDPPPLRFIDGTKEVIIGKKREGANRPGFYRRFELEPLQYAMYKVLAEARCSQLETPEHPDEDWPNGWVAALAFGIRPETADAALANEKLFEPVGARLLDLLENLNPVQVGGTRAGFLGCKNDPETLRLQLNPTLTKLNNALEQNIGYKRLTERYMVERRSRPWRFGLSLDPDSIDLAEEEALG